MLRVWMKIEGTQMYVYTIQGSSRFVSWVLEKDREFALTFSEDEQASCLNILESMTKEKLVTVPVKGE